MVCLARLRYSFHSAPLCHVGATDRNASQGTAHE
jgi:hypothetical protein